MNDPREVKKGDWFAWRGIRAQVIRVSADPYDPYGPWADLNCYGRGLTWSKRMLLPLPDEFVREKP